MNIEAIIERYSEVELIDIEDAIPLFRYSL